jgi:DNA (cytosine-5)-methyltransferase 1
MKKTAKPLKRKAPLRRQAASKSKESKESKAPMAIKRYSGKKDERVAVVGEPMVPYGQGSFRFIDLFCGIGGFHIAFSKQGGECVFASDWDKYAQISYAANHGLTPIGDITKVPVKDIPKHEVLCAGFPCQPFSIAGVSKKNSLGRKHGFEDERQGNLFFNIAEILDHHRPAAFVLENVKNLKSHDRGNTYKVIMDILRNKLGYHVVEPRIIDAKPYVPQHRERIFIVGFCDAAAAERFKWPTPPSEGPKLHTILQPRVPEKYTLTDHLWAYLQNYAAKHKAAGNGFGFGLVGPDDTARTLSARYHKDGSEILINQGRGRNPRRLTPDECALLMGYEDFEIVVSDTQAYRQFGNSVVVPVVTAIAEQVTKALGLTSEQHKLMASHAAEPSTTYTKAKASKVGAKAVVEQDLNDLSGAIKPGAKQKRKADLALA